MFDERYLEYMELFNERYFYDCHEVLEDLWLDNDGPSRKYYQALIHFATAFQHLFRRNMAGFRSRLISTEAYLASYPDQYEGLDLVQIRGVIRYWRELLDRCGDSGPAVLAYDDTRVPMLELQGQ